MATGNCPACGDVYEFDPRQAGKTSTCFACGGALVVAAADPLELPAVKLEHAAPVVPLELGTAKILQTVFFGMAAAWAILSLLAAVLGATTSSMGPGGNVLLMAGVLFFGVVLTLLYMVISVGLGLAIEILQSQRRLEERMAK